MLFFFFLKTINPDISLTPRFLEGLEYITLKPHKNCSWTSDLSFMYTTLTDVVEGEPWQQLGEKKDTQKLN